MRVPITWGQNHGDVEIPAERLISVRRSPTAPSLADPAQAVAAALAQPMGFPPLHRALTPEDHIAIVVDETLSSLPRLLPPLLQHLRLADVSMQSVTLVCPPPDGGQPWLDDLPEEFHEVRVEVHQPGDRRKLAYLATTRHGRRLYLNRSVVDADQCVVLTRRCYDTRLGYGGGPGAIFPALSDDTTLREVHGRLDLTAPGGAPWPLQREAVEVAWLLGVPFFVQIIEDGVGGVAHVVAGPVESSAHAEQLLDERWRIAVDEPADVVLATLAGDARRHTFADLARAWQAAARVTRPGGTIILLTDAAPELGPGAALIRQAEDAGAAAQRILRERPPDLEAAYSWAKAAVHARLVLLSRWPLELAEELFTAPLQHVQQAARLLHGRCLRLPDAQYVNAVLAG
ncbi:MAG: lactate racemase domain-containing protein [Gemmataceae bacterium]|nr:lactate racemase domain-containing protein [Gemmataceae bacterium]